MTKTGRSRGIPHIEDLPVKEFQNAMERIAEYEITEKVDGSEILFGIDDKGFYTSRETHGGGRVYNVEEYGVTFSNTYKRSAHIVLESVLTHLKSAGLEPGDQVEAEVLYGEVPNVVPYSADTSYIIFLRTTEGTVDIDQLKQKLDGHSLNISIMTPFSPNGRDIFYKTVENTWKFSRTPVIPNKIPTHVSRLRDPAEVKNTILEQFVRMTPSAFGPSDGWIEGIVLVNPVTGHRFKVVDKDVFLTEKNHQWKHRDELMEYPRSPKYVNSILGRMLVDIATDLGHDVLGTIMAKKYLRSMGKNTEERLAYLMDGTTRLPHWLFTVRKTRSILSRRLDKYEEEIKVFNHGYSPTSIQRTKETFATFFALLDTMEKGLEKSNNIEEMIMVFLGKQLRDIENET
jgi:hypothetical protein